MQIFPMFCNSSGVTVNTYNDITRTSHDLLGLDLQIFVAIQFAISFSALLMIVLCTLHKQLLPLTTLIL